MPSRDSMRRGAARLSRRANRVLGPVLTHLPGFGVLHHVGRVSGREYRTPLRLIGDPSGGEGFFVLTYGPDTDWYQNLVANPAAFRTQTASYEVSSPRLDQPAHAEVPSWLSLALRALGISNLVRVELARSARPFS